MKCVDTDFLVAVLRGRKEAEHRLKELDAEGRQATTSVNAFELFYGACRSRDRLNNIEKTKALLGRMDILELDLSASEKAGEILAALAEEGSPIDFRDVMIAGISVVNGLPVMTRNSGHFSRIKGLKLQNW